MSKKGYVETFDNVKREIKLFDMRNFEKTINTFCNKQFKWSNISIL